MKQYIIGGSVLSFFIAGLIFAQSQGVINLSRSNASGSEQVSISGTENPFGEGAQRIGQLFDDNGGERNGSDDRNDVRSQETDDRRGRDGFDDDDEEEFEDSDDDNDDDDGFDDSDRRVEDVVTTNSGTSAGSGQTAPPQTPTSGTVAVSRATLALHNTQSDCWVGYKGVVYNITSWLPRHPGSAAVIAPYCGTNDEFTAAFNSMHGTSQETRLKREGTPQGALN